MEPLDFLIVPTRWAPTVAINGVITLINGRING